MEYNKIQNLIQAQIDHYERSGQVSINWDEYSQLEKIYENNYLVEKLKERAKYLHKWMYNIGKEVYLSHNSFHYALVDKFSEMDSLNKRCFDESKSIVFTQEVFNRLCFDYCSYQVKRLTEELIEGSITLNSSSKIENIVFEWKLECKQKLIKIFQSTLDV